MLFGWVHGKLLKSSQPAQPMSAPTTMSINSEASYEHTTALDNPSEKSPSALGSDFTDASNERGRKIYLKAMFTSSLGLTVALLAIFSIYWGALWRTPEHQLEGWVINFDSDDNGDGAIGSAVTQGLLASSSSSKVRWERRDISAKDVGIFVNEQKAWIAITINENASINLINADSDYDPTSAMTIYVAEARNENAFRSILRPTTEYTLQSIYDSFAQQRLSSMSSSTLSVLHSSSPQAITKPISHTLVNLAPFNVPVASAMTFVGLIYLLILSFFIVMSGLGARQASGLERTLSTASLIRVRVVSVLVAYFFISLFYSLLSRAFQVGFSRKFGHSGFLVFWMVNYTGMLSVGLALEAMVTVLTPRFVPFFMLLWVIVNVSVCSMPIDVMPSIYRYGYAMPFYNVSGAVRTILFGTKNEVGLHIGILIAWAALSGLVVLPLSQWYRRRSLFKTALEMKKPNSSYAT